MSYKQYEIRRVMEHVEVYDSNGVFQFSCDSEHEAIHDIKRMERVNNESR